MGLLRTLSLRGFPLGDQVAAVELLLVLGLLIWPLAVTREAVSV